MLCPWCSQKMQEGFLQSSRAVIFGPEVREGTLWPRKEGEVRLTKRLRTMPSTPTWHCAGCRRVVAEYE